MHFVSVYFLYSFLFISFFLPAPCWGDSSHQTASKRPVETDNTSLLRLLEQLLADFNLGLSRKLSEAETAKAVHTLISNPELLRVRSDEILTALKSNTRADTRAACLELLSATLNSDLIPVFESHLTALDGLGQVRFEAAKALAELYKKYPQLVTEERKKLLFNLLKLTDGNDLTRLYLRQLLPDSLSRELDERVFEWKKQNRPPQALKLARTTLGKGAEAISRKKDANPAFRSLAFQFLLESDRPKAQLVKDIHSFFKDLIAEADTKGKPIQFDSSLLNPASEQALKDFLERTSNHPKGIGLRIHDGIQLENLLSAAIQKGVELDRDLVKTIHQLTWRD